MLRQPVKRVLGFDVVFCDRIQIPTVAARRPSEDCVRLLQPRLEFLGWFAVREVESGHEISSGTRGS